MQNISKKLYARSLIGRDVFYGGSIPIYLGAKNIKKYISDKCFINFSDFENLNDL